MKTSTLEVPRLGEPDAHVMMRNMKWLLRTLLIFALIATVVLFLSFRSAAYLAALPVPVLFLAFVFVSYLERQSRLGRVYCFTLPSSGGSGRGTSPGEGLSNLWRVSALPGL